LVTTTAEGRRIRYELADSRLVDALGILAALSADGPREQVFRAERPFPSKLAPASLVADLLPD
jgi:hypothetical protein